MAFAYEFLQKFFQEEILPEILPKIPQLYRKNLTWIPSNISPVILSEYFPKDSFRNQIFLESCMGCFKNPFKIFFRIFSKVCFQNSSKSSLKNPSTNFLSNSSVDIFRKFFNDLLEYHSKFHLKVHLDIALENQEILS